ncbi:MAG: outer membrane protein assembly factor [Desulfobacterales bacterium]|nr:outer membrane protein assembly factor [Desulfobacterales bacterium]
MDVTIKGVTGKVLANVLASLSLYLQKDDPLLNESLIFRLNSKAREEIRIAIEPFGYYHPKIYSLLYTVKDKWKAVYEIKLGSPVYVEKVDIKITGEGKNDKLLLSWLKSFPLKKGDILSHISYEKAKNELLSIAEENGYFKGKLIRREIIVNKKKYISSIYLQFDTGPRYLLGNVSFKQNYFKNEYLKRFVSFKYGDPYVLDKLIQLQRALYDSEHFRKVDVIPRIDSPDRLYVPIEINLSLRESTKYMIGLGYGTDTGPRAGFGIKNRQINSFGHQTGADVEISQIGAKFSSRYDIPLKIPQTDRLSFTFDFSKQNVQPNKRTTFAPAVSITQKISNWRHTFSLSYQDEKFEVGTETGRANLLIPKTSWQRIFADNLINPKNGWSITLETQAALNELASDTNFFQFHMLSKYVKSLWTGSRILARAETGITFISDFSDLPASFRFFTGGDTSVRGYSYNSLGEKNPQGEVIGGKNLLVTSIEYEQIIIEPVALALFYDAGNAFSDFSNINMQKGAGMGIRVKLPFGNISLDIASALNTPNFPLRIHLRIGADL